MTRKKAKDYNWFGHDREEINKHIDKIYDNFEQELQVATSDKTCNGCIHKPKKGENYRLECGECSRFYADNYKGETKC